MRFLDELTAPVGAEEFLAKIYGRTFHAFPGDPDRFGKVFGWADLNEILATHRLDDSQLDLLHGSKLVHHSAYTTKETSKNGIRWHRLVPKRLSVHLLAGATLRLREVDQAHRGVGELAAALERELRERIRVNAYANCTRAESSAVHCDDHDVVVLQVAGAKRWRLYGPAQPLPLPDDPDHPAVERRDPGPDPVALLQLDQGQALYLPRGWWHAAQAFKGPSLHLTVGIYRSTGVDLLHWLVERLRNDETVRADLPRHDVATAQQEYLDRIRELVSTQLADPEVMTRMLADQDAREPVDLGLSFPLRVPDGPGLLEGEFTRIRLLARRAVLEHDGDDVVLRAGAQSHRYGAHLARMLQLLVTGQTAAIAELAAACGDAVSEADIRTLLDPLIADGLVSIVP